VETTRKKQNRFRHVLVGAIALSLVLIAPLPTATAAPTGVWGEWSFTTNTQGSLSFVSPMPSATFQITGGTGSRVSGSSIYLNANTPIGTVYGSSRDRSYASIGLGSSGAVPGDPSITTLTFDTATPISGWSFALGDVDAEDIRISGTKVGGTALTSLEIGAWFTTGGGVFNYCNSGSPKPSGCPSAVQTDVPTWDAADSILKGSGSDTSGATGWFSPNIALETLTFTQTRNVTGGPSYQLWVVALIDGAPVFVRQPANATVNEGSSATFSALVAGTQPFTYQWERSTDGGVTWTTITGATSATYSTGPTVLSQSGHQYRVVVSGPVAPPATSAAATLTVNPVNPPPPPPPEPEPTPTPTPPPPPEPTVDEVFITEEIQQLPAGQALVFEGSTPVQVQVVTNPTQQVQTIQGSTWALDLTALAPNGKPTMLTADGAVDVTAGGELALTGSGLTPGSVVNVFLIDPTESLGSFIVGPDGTFSAMIPVPAGLAAGRYVVQANGTTPAGQVRSTSVGLLVNNRQPRIGTLKATVYFDVRSAVLDKKAKRTLARLARKVPSEASVTRIRSVGFVQPESFTANDQRLSTQRARNVVRQLRKDGVRGPTVIRGNGQAKQSGAKARRATVTVTYEIYQ
jgi:outer membrane protein OmpA-like peptidoglycan-associated protein